jgi:hypothetical protein
MSFGLRPLITPLHVLRITPFDYLFGLRPLTTPLHILRLTPSDYIFGLRPLHTSSVYTL